MVEIFNIQKLLIHSIFYKQISIKFTIATLYIVYCRITQNLQTSMSAQTISLQQDQTFSCPICLNILIMPITLTCGHTFCEPCIKCNQYKHMKSSCPLCRKNIPFKANLYCVNVILNNLIQSKYGHLKSYKDKISSVKKSKSQIFEKLTQKIIQWIKDKLPYIVILVLLYYLLKIKINVTAFSLERYKKKLLEIAESIKGQDSLDFKLLLFSQFMKLFFSNLVAIP